MTNRKIRVALKGPIVVGIIEDDTLTSTAAYFNNLNEATAHILEMVSGLDEGLLKHELAVAQQYCLFADILFKGGELVQSEARPGIKQDKLYSVFLAPKGQTLSLRK